MADEITQLSRLLTSINQAYQYPIPTKRSIYHIPFPQDVVFEHKPIDANSPQIDEWLKLLSSGNLSQILQASPQNDTLTINEFILWTSIAIGLRSHLDHSSIHHLKHKLYLGDEQQACIEAVYLYAKVCIGTTHKDTYLHTIARETFNISDTFDRALLRIGHVMGWTSVQQSVRHIGTSNTLSEAVSLAFYIAIRYQTDWQGAIACASHQPHHYRLIMSLTSIFMTLQQGQQLSPKIPTTIQKIAEELSSSLNQLFSE